MTNDTHSIPVHVGEKANLWGQLRLMAAKAGSEVLEKALYLYFAAQKPGVPARAKAVIYSALAYLVLPADAVSDILPGIGYSDDLGALAAALAIVSLHIDEAVKAQARAKLHDWFGA